MIGYPYIQALFKTILNSSKVIQGNFFVCPKWGSELANPNIDERMAVGQPKANKYPAVLLMPPPKRGYFQYSGTNNSGTTGYDIYTIQLLFVAGSNISGANQPLQPTTLGASTHSITDTWHDMDRVAQNFMVVLGNALIKGGQAIIWDAPDSVPKIRLITNLGQDSVSGVMLTFTLAVNPGCDVEDYPADWQTTVSVPAYVDTHPLHSM